MLHIDNNILYDDTIQLKELSLSPLNVSIQVWKVPYNYSANGYFVSIDNSVPTAENAIYVGHIEYPADPQLYAAYRQKQIVDNYTDIVQNILDKTAQSRGYDNFISLSTYVNSSYIPFKNDAINALAWRDSVWVTCFDILAKGTSGEIPIPTEEEFITMLPLITW